MGKFGKVGQMAGMANKARQMKSKIKKVEKDLKKTIISHSSEDGMITVNMNAKFAVKNVIIDEKVFQESNVKKLEENIKSVFNTAINEAQDISESRMAELSKDIDLSSLQGMM